MKDVKKLIALSVAVMMTVLSLASCGSSQYKPKEIFEYVFDAGTYKSLDYDYADAYFRDTYDNNVGCSAIATIDANGNTIVGRNLDLNISNKAAYIVRTDVKGCYKTMGLMYTFRDISPDYKVVKENGLPEQFRKVLPFMADDIINEKGLYIEINMRNAEFWPTGVSKYSCPGTNPTGERRIYMFEVPRYIAEHCATVDEAIAYIKNMDVYSKDGYWNYAFLIADAQGNYGVLEYADNMVFWNEGQQAQTNFYVTPNMKYIQELQAGLGRYNNMMKGIDNVKTEEDMFNLMDSVSYFQFYNIDNCKFDYRSENVGALKWATYDMVTDPEAEPYFYMVSKYLGDTVMSKSRQQLQDANEYWESSFTEVINCNEKTILVRFFEDDNKIIKLHFDNDEVEYK